MRSKYETEFDIKSFNRNSFSKQIYAYDLAYDLENKGEVKNIDVIKQRIGTILTTIPGERFFNITFGTSLYSILFNEPTSKRTAEKALHYAINDIKKYIPEIKINNSKSSAETLSEDSIQISISFKINGSDIDDKWEDIIYF